MRINAGFVAVAVAAVWLSMGADARADPAAAERHYKQGVAYFNVGAFDEALAAFEAAYAADPQPRFVFNIARMHVELEHTEEALAAYQRYLEVEPSGPGVPEAKARIAALEAALAARREQLRTRRAAADKRAIARAAVARGDHALAIAELEAAYDLSRDPEVLFELADALRRSADLAKALVYYEAYLAESGDTRRKLEARAQIKELERVMAERRASLAVSPEPAPPASSAAGVAGVGTPLVAEPVPERDAPARPRVRWAWAAAAAAVVATAVVIDAVPDSSSNGSWDALDFVPVGLYGVGAVAVYVAVF